MECPKCGGRNLYVIDCRDRARTNTGIYRRRECANCGERISTYEVTKDEYKELARVMKLKNDIDKAVGRYEQNDFRRKRKEQTR